MGDVRGCDMPDDLLYNVENNVWARREDDGRVTMGLTSYACNLAGQIVSFTPKKAGRSVKLDKSCATVESGKWVGPAKAPVAGEVVEANDAVAANPGLINEDPYNAGWLVRIQPDSWDTDSAGLKSGSEAMAAFEAKMDAEGFDGC